MDELFFRIGITQSFLIPIEQMRDVLSSVHREWVITRTQRRVDYTASLASVYGISGMNILGNEIDIASRNHCQGGTDAYIYDISPIHFRPQSMIAGKMKKTRMIKRKCSHTTKKWRNHSKV